MKRIVMMMAICSVVTAQADVTLSGKVETKVVRPITAVTTNTVSYENVKAVYTSFSANWAPAYSNACWYTLTYHLQDLKTKQMIPGTQVTDRLTPKDLMAKLGIDVTAAGAGIGQMIDAYLESKFKKVAPVQ
jgi:hypothetical protein